MAVGLQPIASMTPAPAPTATARSLPLPLPTWAPATPPRTAPPAPLRARSTFHEGLSSVDAEAADAAITPASNRLIFFMPGMISSPSLCWSA
ncbi:MAG: hypothetical protein B7X91_11395 [Hydrogenophilales bacterium 17-64-11]|nr:MAG: hypothetical protein B7X91_11395 [Hydrogenophilales bacterium 17-64-11]